MPGLQDCVQISFVEATVTVFLYDRFPRKRIQLFDDVMSLRFLLNIFLETTMVFPAALVLRMEGLRPGPDQRLLWTRGEL